MLGNRRLQLSGADGNYLFFEEAESNGSIAFSVLDVRTGRTIINDVSDEGLTGGSLHAVTATPNMLKLTFRRAMNTECSILAKPAACWQAITRDKHNDIPPSIARLGPPV